MKTVMSRLPWMLPNALNNSLDLGLTNRSYKQLRFILFSIMLLISMGPVLLVGMLSYRNYDLLIKNEEHDQLEWQLEGAIKSFEQMIESLKSVVLFAARRDRYTELTSNSNLEQLFVRLQRQYPYFADLGVIDQDGVQQAYYGPYDLEGTDYHEEEWFKVVFDSGVYISKVYKGYRQVPHFAIAVGNLDPKTKKLWILRATIDAVSLQQFVNTTLTRGVDDIFLIDQEGVLQTSSLLYGEPLDLFNTQWQHNAQAVLTSNHEDYLYTINRISNTPWSLVLMRKHYVHQAEWQDFRRHLYLIMFTCSIIAILVVYSLVSLLSAMIQKADEVQLAMLKDAEHTDKLASVGRLAAGVGHEINNPLAIIDQKTGLIEDLLSMVDTFEHKATIEQCLQVITQNVDRCKAITHRLLGFARRTDVSLEKVNINEIIREVLQFLENSMTYNRIKIELKLGDNLPPLTSDRLQLQQVLLNIINNAIDAIGRDGEISIITYLVAGDIRIVIQDNGPGIDEEILPHIFEPFYTTKETGKGTGLGLSITYGLIKKLGGDITVRSKLDVGTAFTLTLPLENKDNDQ